MKRNKHLTKDECQKIEHLLKEQVSLKQIASRLGINMSTILREARIFAQSRDKFERYRIQNNCAKREDCGKRYLCCDNQSCSKNCSMCDLCNELCDDFDMYVCFRLYESPYCCDGCNEEYKCVLRKVFYLNKRAYEAYREKISGSQHEAFSIGDDLLTLDKFAGRNIRSQSDLNIVNLDQTNAGKKTRRGFY